MIGLFFGDNDFPKKILKKIKKIKKAYFIIDLSTNKSFKNDNNSYPISIGQFGKIINLIKKKNVKMFFLREKLKNQIFQNLN